MTQYLSKIDNCIGCPVINKFRILSLLFAVVMAAGTALGMHAQSDREIASRFAPVFYQALGDKPRSDYITNFDFDGDWLGNNNWRNTDNVKFPLRAYVYYSVSETQTHYFIHYAVFHPRDYKGGERKGLILSEIIREGVKRASDGNPTGLMADATAAHENDMEGALVVAAKSGNDPDNAKVVFVETLYHNTFRLYAQTESRSNVSGVFRTDGQRVLLYIEPKGHGIQAYSSDERQSSGKGVIIYKYGAKAGDPDKRSAGPVDYELLPIETTLWQKARAAAKNLTFGTFRDYGEITINVVQSKGGVAAKKVKVGNLASAFLGGMGGINMARPPWGWFDKDKREDPLGLWFFDPAKIVKRDFALGETFSTAYVSPPFWAAK